MRPEEIYNQKKGRLRALLADPAFNQAFPGQRGVRIKQSLDIVFRDLDALVRGQQPRPGPNEVRLVGQTVRMVHEIVLYEPLNKYMSDFISLYVEVVKNWNVQIVRARDLDLMLDATARLVAGYMTFLDAINTMRRFVDRFERMMRYTPPSFDLAKHYLQVILDKYERGEPINRYEEAKQKVARKKAPTTGGAKENKSTSKKKKDVKPTTVDLQPPSSGGC